MRAHDYYVEAARNQMMAASCKFSSHSCANGLGGYNNGTCLPTIGNFSRVAYEIETRTGDGMQYLETNSSSPFCKS